MSVNVSEMSATYGDLAKANRGDVSGLESGEKTLSLQMLHAALRRERQALDMVADLLIEVSNR